MYGAATAITRSRTHITLRTFWFEGEERRLNGGCEGIDTFELTESSCCGFGAGSNGHQVKNLCKDRSAGSGLAQVRIEYGSSLPERLVDS